MPVRRPFNFKQWIDEHRHLLKPPVGNKCVYEDAEFIVMVVGGPNSRKDYHFDEGEEFFYQLEGDILVKIQEDGRAVDVPVREGEIFLLPPRVPHNPVRGENTVGLVIERKRRDGEMDGLLWFCENCNAKLYEEYFALEDITTQFQGVFKNSTATLSCEPVKIAVQSWNRRRSSVKIRMEREYYDLWYRLDGKDSYLIWFSSDEPEADGVLVDENGFVPAFDNIKALQNLAKSYKIELVKEEPRLLDLDVVKNWLEETNNKIVDYNPFLDAWNLFGDVSRSTNKEFIKVQYYEIYERIFWGCNIPAVTPEGESFTPTWTKKELKTIREIMSSGLKMFTETVNPQ